MNYIYRKLNQDGFTLVELIILLTVMGFFASLIIPMMPGLNFTIKEKADEITAQMYAKDLIVLARLGELVMSEGDIYLSEAVLNSDLNGDDDLLDNVEIGESGCAFTYSYDGDVITVNCGDNVSVSEESAIEND